MTAAQANISEIFQYEDKQTFVSKHREADWMIGISSTILDLMKGEKFYPETIHFRGKGKERGRGNRVYRMRQTFVKSSPTKLRGQHKAL